ncbi:MAG TPA: LuxR C-terminal-related transcriptional regulator [Ktedonobacterales bacterium]
MNERTSHQEDALILDLADIGAGAFSVDRERRIVSWNRAAEVLLGFEAGQVLGRRCAEVLHGCTRAPDGVCRRDCVAALSGASGARQPLGTFEAHVATRDGGERWISLGALEARTIGGQRRLVHIFRDVSQYHVLDDSVARAFTPPPTSQPNMPPSDEAVSLVSGAGTANQLTPREMEALKLLACGLGTREIAETLGISRVTARNHVTKVMDKLGVRTRLQAVIVAAQLHLI